DLARRNVWSHGTESNTVNHDGLARCGGTRRYTRDGAGWKNIGAVGELGNHVLIAADLERRRSQKAGLRCVHGDVERRAVDTPIRHDDLRRTSANVRRQLRIHLTGGDVVHERLLTPDGDLNPVEHR